MGVDVEAVGRSRADSMAEQSLLPLGIDHHRNCSVLNAEQDEEVHTKLWEMLCVLGFVQMHCVDELGLGIAEPGDRMARVEEMKLRYVAAAVVAASK